MLVNQDTKGLRCALRRNFLNNREIRVSTTDSALLFFFNRCWPYKTKSCINRSVCYCCPFTWKKKRELLKLYTTGQEKIEGDTDIINFVKSLKTLKKLAEKHLDD